MPNKILRKHCVKLEKDRMLLSVYVMFFLLYFCPLLEDRSVSLIHRSLHCESKIILSYQNIYPAFICFCICLLCSHLD